jgi:NitT/TauT family transport system permease protein
MALDLREREPLTVDLDEHERSRAWSATWPKLAAIALVFLVWQTLVWIHWKPTFALTPPADALRELRHLVSTSTFWEGVTRTMRRAITGYALAVAIGGTIGLAVARVRLLRSAIGSLITGLQTMPSIAWFPLAILLFTRGEGTILFVVVLGAAPSVANGIVAGVDHVPPILLRAGRVVGARGVALYRHVVLPAALPSVVSGLKQGWAFAWRSLMAGELLVTVPGHASIGTSLNFARDNNDAAGVVAWMITILVIGIVVDAVFSRFEVSIRRRRGLIEAT